MLNLRRLFVGYLAAACLTSALWVPNVTAEEEFTLARVIPNDVFIFQTCRKNPDRQFLDDYWSEVFSALKDSGVDEDLVELFGTTLGLDEEQAGEIARLKERFSDLIGDVDWKQLEGSENVFAERFQPLEKIIRGQPVVMAASMVWLSRGTPEATKQNYESVVAILEAIIEETNKALGREAMKVKRSAPMGTQMASVNLLAAAPGAPRLPLSVARHEDILMIAFREDLIDDVLHLMNGKGKGKGSQKPLADDPRFQAAFAQLPPAKDSLVYFDMQALLKPLRESIELVFNMVAHPKDVYLNTGMTAEASKLNGLALAAYRRGNYKEALELIQKAHQVEPEDTIILYNLACFNALVGNQDEALDWLNKAVEGGFHAPHKISTDADLTDLRDKPKYKQALALAHKLAGECCGEDVAINYVDSGDVRSLRLQVHQAYKKKDYDQALEFIEQAFALAPDDSQVLYAMGCLHTLKGHEEKGLDFLHQAVEAGFYCPKQISKDPDWNSVREDPRFEQAVVKAQKKAGEITAGTRQAKAKLIKRLFDRQLDAAGTLDYSATVEWTDGHSVWSETITALVPDAQDRPIYPVFSQRQPLADFAKYLPKETSAFSISGGVDLRELYKYIEDSFRGGGPLGKELLAQWDEIQAQIGLDVKRDVVDLIEGDSITVTLADGGGSVSMFKVSDEQKAYEKIDQVFAALPKLLTEAISKQPAMGGLAALAVRSSPLTHEELDGFQSIHIAMSPQPVGVWGTADGYLIFGNSAESVALCLATSRNDHPNIQGNETAIRDAIVPAGPFVNVSLTDRRSSAKEVATTMGAASMVGGMVAASIPKPELRPVIGKMISILGKLAPVVRKVDFYKSVAANTTFDGKMWRSRSVTHYQSPNERREDDESKQAATD